MHLIGLGVKPIINNTFIHINAVKKNFWKVNIKFMRGQYVNILTACFYQSYIGGDVISGIIIITSNGYVLIESTIRTLSM